MEKLTLRSTRHKKLDSITDSQLAADRGHMSVAYMARLYGVSRSTLYTRLRKAGLVDEEPDQLRQKRS